jgi:hypothetical protein
MLHSASPSERLERFQQCRQPPKPDRQRFAAMPHNLNRRPVRLDGPGKGSRYRRRHVSLEMPLRQIAIRTRQWAETRWLHNDRLGAAGQPMVDAK